MAPLRAAATVAVVVVLIPIPLAASVVMAAWVVAARAAVEAEPTLAAQVGSEVLALAT
jgi:hypothetical protein